MTREGFFASCPARAARLTRALYTRRHRSMAAWLVAVLAPALGHVASLEQLRAFEQFGGSTIFPKVGESSNIFAALTDPHAVHRAANHSGIEDTLRCRSEHLLTNKKNRRCRGPYYGVAHADCRLHAFMEAAGLSPLAPRRDEHKRIFLEMGALNGLQSSNSLFFERAGWNGILIEGMPGNCKELETIRVSGRSINICSAICPAANKAIELEIIGSSMGRTGNARGFGTKRPAAAVAGARGAAAAARRPPRRLRPRGRRSVRLCGTTQCRT